MMKGEFHAILETIPAHPKIKLFITQCGLQSMEEAIDRHVPMLAIPFMADQFGNSDKVIKLEIGRTIDINRMTPDMLQSEVMEVIGNRK